MKKAMQACPHGTLGTVPSPGGKRIEKVVGTIVIVLLLFLAACVRKNREDKDLSASLILCQAQFTQEMGEEGKTRSVPGAAQLLLISYRKGMWVTEKIEDTESNVFHKALPFKEGFITIGANAAALKLWSRKENGWSPQTIWKPSFGGSQNRLRDIEYGDVTGDGKDDLVVATHDQGVIAVLQEREGIWEVTELNRTSNTFVHEIEIGDVNGDGINEFFATPSAPNKVDGSPQPGAILMFRYNGTSFERSVVEEFPTRHVKEILVADVEGRGVPALFAVLEAEMTQEAGTARMVDSVKIKQYRLGEGGWAGSILASLPDGLCRFLTWGDVDGDGMAELVASTFRSGIWILKRSVLGWNKELLDGNSSGFEHATLIYDLDDNGVPEIYVAADDQGELRRYQWDGKKLRREVLLSLPVQTLTFNLNALPF